MIWREVIIPLATILAGAMAMAGVILVLSHFIH